MANTRVFFIGFNKCGTTSFHRLFQKSGLKSAHWEIPNKRFLAPFMLANWQFGRPVMFGLDEFSVFSDMNYISSTCYIESNFLFDVIHRENPEGIFVLNTRSLERWISSRERHVHPTDGSLLMRAQKVMGLDKDGVKDVWRKNWKDHHDRVRRYFGNHKDSFREFNIESDDIDNLLDFFARRGLMLDKAFWKHHNPTRKI